MSSAAYLIICFVVNGLTSVGNKALIALRLDRFADFYMLVFWVVGLIMALVIYGVTRHSISRKDVSTGLAMGIFGGLSTVTFIETLKHVDGAVAFPVRGAANIALTAVFAYILWRERITAVQKLGILCGMAAIYLLL